MKRCNACQEEFAEKFSFCPVDGSLLNSLAALVGKDLDEIRGDERSRAGRPCHDADPRAGRPWHDADPRAGRPCHAQSDFHVTMLSSTTLWHRLAREGAFAIGQLRLLWPEFKREPITVARRELKLSMNWLKMALQPNTLLGMISAVVLVVSAGLCVLLIGDRGGRPAAIVSAAGENAETVEMLDLRLLAAMLATKDDKVGTGSQGRVGFNQGKGEGSLERQKHARGGGGGGDRNPIEAGVGKIPVPSAIPALISRALPNTSLPAAGIDLDPALWKNLPFVAYGDPLSKSVSSSHGPGDRGGIGDGDGLGIGKGNGNGVGLGTDGNMGGGPKDPGGKGPGGGKGDGTGGGELEHIYRVPEVTQRARVLSKPEPQYTEAARTNQITGSVVLSVIFTESGEVSGIRPLKTLPFGLTERAIAAARQIRFMPAMRNGRPVSVYMQLEYNFNLY